MTEKVRTLPDESHQTTASATGVPQVWSQDEHT